MTNYEEIIVYPERDEENLCMYYAIYNALPTMELRQAFSCNNNQPPSKAFVELIKEYKSIQEIREKGYSEKDMLRYLRHLKKTDIIKEFTWKRIKARTATFHTVWETPPKEQEVFVLFGLCTTGDDRETLIKRIKRVKREGSESGASNMKEQIRVYHNLKVSRRECTDHAIAITSSDKGLQISDNAKKRKCTIQDMTNVATSLVSFHCLYVLRINI